VREVSDYTGFPEMMDGRVKTLHPKVHGGILALRDVATHTGAMAEHGIAPIDLVVVNLYPFEATVQKPGVTRGGRRSRTSTSAVRRWCVPRRRIIASSASSPIRRTTDACSTRCRRTAEG
jgi:hypothetical protein